jgi:hypothetical protein
MGGAIWCRPCFFRYSDEMKIRHLFAAAAIIALTTGHGQARPIDDALSTASRCASIADLRTWLDCYYGAAQPVRASLGLKPALKTQLDLATAPPAGTIPPADVPMRNAIMAAAFQCNGDTRQWLDCYYAAVQPARIRLGLEKPTGTAPPVPQPSGFGLTTPPKRAADQIVARMQSYSFGRDHRFQLQLDNGQVWRQLEGDDAFARWNRPAPNYVVRISRGMFGSYNLQVANNPGMFKVRRVQ